MHLLCLQRHVSHAALRAAILPACACRRIQAHASSCSESGVAGGTIRQSFCSALQAELAEFYHLMAVLQEQSLREAPKPDNLASGDSTLGSLYSYTIAISLPSTMSIKLVPHLHEAAQILSKQSLMMHGSFQILQSMWLVKAAPVLPRVLAALQL